MPDFSLPKLALLAVFLAALPCRAAEPRLAIVSTDEAREIAGLATAKLGGKYALLERDDLAKAGDERKLTELALADSRALGQIVGADGLLFLSREGGQYRARLTAVHLGFAVFDLQFQKDAEPEDVVAKIAARLEEFAPKLTLTAREAIPVSVLNLRTDSTSDRSDEIERQATLLLENRLSAIPEVILLERRHASALAFEKSLSTLSPDLLRSAAVVDGTLRLANGGKQIEARLRLRKPGEETQGEIEASGSAGDLAGLADALAGRLAKALDASFTPDAASAKAEAREYLMEGIWARRRDLPAPALEALDSSEILGGASPDLIATRIPVLCRLAVGTVRDIVPEPPMKDLSDATAEISYLRRAIADLAIYRAEKKEEQLEHLEPKGAGDGRTSELKRITSRSVGKMIAMLDRTGNPAAESFREEARDYFGFDPQKGAMPGDWDTCIDYAGNLARSKDEQTAYYRALGTTYPWAAYGAWKLQLRVLPDTFCERFIPDKESRRDAYFSYVRSLLNDPVARVAGLLYLAQHAPAAEKNAACLALYAEILKDKEELQKTGRLAYILRYAMKLEERRRVSTAHPDLLAAMRYYFQHATKVSDVTFGIWNPELFPPDQAPALYRELEAFQKRYAAAGGNSSYLRWMHQKYINKFGDPNAKPLPELPVTRFWYPRDVTGQFLNAPRGLIPIPGGVALLGSYGEAEYNLRYYEIKLPGLETTAFDMGVQRYPDQLVWTPSTLLVFCRAKAKPNAPAILCLDRPAGKWTEHSAPKNMLEMFEAWGKYYLILRNSGTGTPESGIALFNEKTGESMVLADSRRKPAQNQFDDCREYRVAGVFPGPDHTSCALIGNSTFAISEAPGTWTPVTQVGVMNQICRVGDRTLLYGPSSHKNTSEAAIMIDATLSAPQVWLGSPAVLKKWAPPKSGVPAENITPPAWTSTNVWPAEEGPIFRMRSYGFRGDDLFGLLDNGVQGKSADMVYYRKGRATPYRFSLRFEMPPDGLAALKAAINNSANTFEMTITPQKFPYVLQMTSTREGICFRAPIHGFWFIPFSDIDALLAKLPEETAGGELAAAPAPQPPAAKPPKPDPNAEPGDVVDPANPDSFR